MIINAKVLQIIISLCHCRQGIENEIREDVPSNNSDGETIMCDKFEGTSFFTLMNIVFIPMFVGLIL